MSNSLLNEEFQKCLEKFPELKDVDVELMVENCDELAGAQGQWGNKKIIILLVPEGFKDKLECLIPIIYHELSHIISKGSEECEKIFYERADEESKQVWKLLKNSQIGNCKIER